MSKLPALIIDDEPDIRELLEMSLRSLEIDCVCVGDLRQARQQLEKEKFSLCLTDMRLPDGDGLEMVRYCQERYPAMPIAVLTAYGNMEFAIQALKSGAFDFLSKPVDVNILRTTIRHALGVHRLPVAGEQDLIGDSPGMRELRETVHKLGRSQAPVHIYGESGTGKELVARMIHATSVRAKGVFLPVNCAAIPAELLESEFFGHVKGSFTGAVADKEGLFQAASGGTLFLDEVAELPQYMQVKLLRVIQEKSVRPVGARQEFPVDARVLSATNQDLQSMVRQGKFRQELYYRINVINLRVPPLRERKEDIPSLAAHMLEKISSAESIPCPRLEPEAVRELQACDWAGNVRELENVLERAVALGASERIRADQLRLPEPLESGDGENGNLEQLLSDVEKKRILKALEETRWNRTAAAKKLGMSLRALRYRLQKFGLGSRSPAKEQEP